MARVVIIGSGVIGASIAWHLAARGMRDVLVLDRAPSFGGGSGSTARATGGFRLQFSSVPNVRLSLLSLEELLRFPEDTGVDPGYRPAGYLFVARTTKEVAALEAANVVQRACGVFDAQIIGVDEILRLNPAIEDGSIAGGAFCPRDGFIRPTEILRGYYEAARRLGVRFLFGEALVRFEAEGGRIAAVRTRAGEHGGDVFVNAAGAWAGGISDVPVKPLVRHVATTVPTDVLGEAMPMTIWLEDGFHLRVRDGRVLLLRSHEAAYGFDLELDARWLADVARRAGERIPVLRSIPIDRTSCWSGLYEMTADRHVILGHAPEYENLLLAVGSSGHGVMHSPAIGRVVAELIAGDRPSLDLQPLRASRFVEGAPIAGSELL